jgi:hypothetical protein
MQISRAFYLVHTSDRPPEPRLVETFEIPVSPEATSLAFAIPTSLLTACNPGSLELYQISPVAVEARLGGAWIYLYRVAGIETVRLQISGVRRGGAAMAYTETNPEHMDQNDRFWASWKTR